MSDTLIINEIYLSVQGESTFAGLPCVFVRLTACNLRCSYCDTAYAFTEGKRMSLEEVRAQVRTLAAPYSPMRNAEPGTRKPEIDRRLPLVELTGGEPLLQPATLPLMKSLCDDGVTVLLETSGALDIAPVDPRVRRIMDLLARTRLDDSFRHAARTLNEEDKDESRCTPEYCGEKGPVLLHKRQRAAFRGVRNRPVIHLCLQCVAGNPNYARAPKFSLKNEL